MILHNFKNCYQWSLLQNFISAACVVTTCKILRAVHCTWQWLLLEMIDLGRNTLLNHRENPFLNFQARGLRGKRKNWPIFPQKVLQALCMKINHTFILSTWQIFSVINIEKCSCTQSFLVHDLFSVVSKVLYCQFLVTVIVTSCIH